MALMSGSVEVDPSSLEEVVQQPIWVDAMVEEYDSIIRNSVWKVLPRPTDKSVVSSRWIYKVKKETDGNVEKHMAYLWIDGSIRWRELIMRRIFSISKVFFN